jgi:hypothetical protein
MLRVLPFGSLQVRPILGELPQSCSAYYFVTGLSIYEPSPQFCLTGSAFDDKRFIEAGGMWYTFMFSGWQRRLRFPSHGQVVSIRRKTVLRKFSNQAYYLLAAGSSGNDSDLLSVIAPVLAEAAKRGVPAITEADTPQRKALLESVGFAAVASTSALQVNVDIMLKAPSA